MSAPAYYHGSVYHRFVPGELVVPGQEVRTWANWSAFDTHTSRELKSGRVVHPQEVVWLTPIATEAENWGSHSLLKALPSEIRQHDGIGVYEVEPFELDEPVVEHGDGERCCARARVIREVSWLPIEKDLCDYCGDPATVGLGTDEQLCADCHAHEVEA